MVRQNISSEGLRPAFQELAKWHKVADIYRSRFEITALGRASNVLSSKLADPIADVRVLAAGGSSTLTDKIINDELAELEPLRLHRGPLIWAWSRAFRTSSTTGGWHRSFHMRGPKVAGVVSPPRGSTVTANARASATSRS
jgi:hypothetical protein